MSNAKIITLYYAFTPVIDALNFMQRLFLYMHHLRETLRQYT